MVHRITPAGREELDRWLNGPSLRTRGYRDNPVQPGMMTGAAAPSCRLIVWLGSGERVGCRAVAGAAG